jgi:putative hydrolase of the HAD superfamily
MRAPVLLVDYGGVISRPQPAASIRAMAALVAVQEPTFSDRYWAHRPAHDRGVEARAYWSAVAGRDLTDQRVVDQLVRIDVASWSHLNDGTLDVLREARANGYSMSILSNAPHEMAAALHVHPALVIFDHLLFSSELGVVKPNAAAFRAALERLACAGADVLFVDDRPDNVSAAEALGIGALLFTSANQLRAELAR